MGVEEIHNGNLVHRDIKPENLLFDESGYLKIIDFGISKFFFGSEITNTSGTPGYMAPEILNKENHGFSVDFYALGVILYELVMQKRPYEGGDKTKLREQQKKLQVKIEKKDLVVDVSEECVDFINQLIQV